MLYNPLNKINLFWLGYSLQNFFEQNKKFIIKQLNENTKNVALSSVTRWHDWQDIDSYYSHCSYGVAKGWVYKNRRYQFRELRLDEFKFFGICETIENWECEIQDITGLSASKSELRNFSSLDEMVETNSKEMIFPINHEKLEQNLNWREVRIFHKNSSDSLVTHAWDKRIFLANSGGSHHFASARYQAKRLNKKIPIKGKLKSYRINENSVDSLIKQFEMFVIPNHHDFTHNFHELMEFFKVDYFIRYLPEPYKHNYCVLLLPRGNKYSMKTAEILKKNKLFNFGLFLIKLLKLQQA